MIYGHNIQFLKHLLILKKYRVRGRTCSGLCHKSFNESWAIVAPTRTHPPGPGTPPIDTFAQRHDSHIEHIRPALGK